MRIVTAGQVYTVAAWRGYLARAKRPVENNLPITAYDRALKGFCDAFSALSKAESRPYLSEFIRINRTYRKRSLRYNHAAWVVNHWFNLFYDKSRKKQASNCAEQHLTLDALRDWLAAYPAVLKILQNLPDDQTFLHLFQFIVQYQAFNEALANRNYNEAKSCFADLSTWLKAPDLQCEALQQLWLQCWENYSLSRLGFDFKSELSEERAILRQLWEVTSAGVLAHQRESLVKTKVSRRVAALQCFRFHPMLRRFTTWPLMVGGALAWAGVTRVSEPDRRLVPCEVPAILALSTMDIAIKAMPSGAGALPQLESAIAQHLASLNHAARFNPYLQAAVLALTTYAQHRVVENYGLLAGVVAFALQQAVTSRATMPESPHPIALTFQRSMQ